MVNHHYFDLKLLCYIEPDTPIEDEELNNPSRILWMKDLSCNTNPEVGHNIIFEIPATKRRKAVYVYANVEGVNHFVKMDGTGIESVVVTAVMEIEPKLMMRLKRAYPALKKD
jgi:hypothetical protein